MTKSHPTSLLLKTTLLSQKKGNGKPAEGQKPDSIALLAQADLLLLLAQIFAPPSAKMPVMQDIETLALEELLQKTGSSDPGHLREVFQQLRQLSKTTNIETWMGEYNRLFETNVACPINETGFIRRDKGVILADIAGFYKAFGFELSEAATEKADHLTGELEFFAMLLVMLAQAQDEEAQRTTYNALSAFSADHIGDWLPTFCERLTETTNLRFYQRLAELLQGVWSEVVTINGLPIPSGEITGLPEDSGTPYECGMVGGCKGVPQ